jgi:hypothetical protein
MYYTTNYCKTTSGHFNVTLVNEGVPIKPHNDKFNNGIRKLTRQKKGAPTANEKSQGNCKFIFPESIADGVKAENQRFQRKEMWWASARMPAKGFKVRSILYCQKSQAIRRNVQIKAIIHLRRELGRH